MGGSASVPRQIGTKAFETFSAHLLALDRMAPTAAPSRLMRQGLAGLRELVPFDAAWWGESSGGIEGLAPRNWLSGRINLSADFAREWNRIGQRDRFAHESMQRLDTVVREFGYADPDPAIESFARRHDLHQAMAVTRAFPASGLLQFVSIYRHRGGARFTPLQAHLFEHFTAHLMQRWSARIAALIDGAGVRAGADAHALLDAAGEFVYLGAKAAQWLAASYPAWHDTLAPAELLARLKQPAATQTIGRRRVAIERCGELTLLSLASPRHAVLLPPRELSVALLYADGRSHKEVARDTGLSPSTVRTYLRDAYLRLGVSDKVSLGRALAGRRARAATG